MMGALVSIIVPVFNTEKYLERCLNSLIDQTYKNIEIILVDDGSTDHSKGICDRFEKEDHRVKVIHKKNEGSGRAREAGISFSKGEYLCFCDSDDYVERIFIERLLEAMIKGDYDIVQCGYKTVDINGKLIRNYDVTPTVILGNKEGVNYFLSNNFPRGLCNKIFKRNIFDDISHSTFRRGQDYFVSVQAFAHAHSTAYIGGCFYNYVMTPQSSTRQAVSERALDEVKVCEFVYNFCYEHYPDLCEQQALSVCTLAADLYYQFFKENRDKKCMRYLEQTFMVYRKKSNGLKLSTSNRGRIYFKLFEINPGFAVIIRSFVRLMRI